MPPTVDRRSETLSNSGAKDVAHPKRTPHQDISGGTGHQKRDAQVDDPVGSDEVCPPHLETTSVPTVPHRVPGLASCLHEDGQPGDDEASPGSGERRPQAGSVLNTGLASLRPRI